jgi:hypothetical protein
MNGEQLIFLNLNSISMIHKNKNGKYIYEKEKVVLLKIIFDTIPRAKIVLSNSWRKESITRAKKFLECVDFPFINNVGGITEELESKNRSEEIDWFIFTNVADEYYLNYVIVDDSMDFTDEQLQYHFVHVNKENPLTISKIDEIIDILNGKKRPLE